MLVFYICLYVYLSLSMSIYLYTRVHWSLYHSICFLYISTRMHTCISIFLCPIHVYLSTMESLSCISSTCICIVSSLSSLIYICTFSYPCIFEFVHVCVTSSISMFLRRSRRSNWLHLDAHVAQGIDSKDPLWSLCYEKQSQ